jgi:hypothetical protein
MALDPAKFHTNSGGGRQIHSYNAAADNAATVAGAGYFNAITGRLHQGDVIHVVSTAGSVLQDYVVTSATGAPVVTVAVAT